MTAEQVKAALRKRHGMDNSTGMWVCVDEAFCGWRSRGGGIDLLAIGVWDSATAPGLKGVRQVANPAVAYEVKVSRSDFKRELYGRRRRWPQDDDVWVGAWPEKARWAIEKTNYFMFAVPKGLLLDHEVERREPPEEGRPLFVPPGVGLIEVDASGCSVRIPATSKEARPWKRGETAELIRHALDPNYVRTLRGTIAQQRQTIEWMQGQLDRLRELEERDG
jgi:hypothetical protein